MESKLGEQFWIFKDRSSVKHGIAKIPISVLLLGCSIAMLILFCFTWLVEKNVLPNLIGFELPVLIKVLSLLSTLFLFTFLIASTGVIYFVVISSVVYFITHSLLVSGLVEYFWKFKEFGRPLMKMLYYSPDEKMFGLLLALCVARLVLVLPFCYYSLVLYTMRRAGGTGWNSIPAFQLEVETIPKEIERLQKRRQYVQRRYDLLSSA